MNFMLLMMGGSGTRFGADRPKQYVLVNGRPLFAYITKGINKLTSVDRLVIVSHKDWIDYVQDWAEKTLTKMKYDVVEGGNTRSESVLNGLTKLAEYATYNDVVMISDATHPYVDEPGINKIIETVNEYGGATLGERSYDTVYKINPDMFLEKVEPRELIYAGASPEAFRFGDIYGIYKNASKEELDNMPCAGAIALAHNIPMKVVEASVLNVKITYPRDMDLFVKLVDSYFFKEDQ